MKIYTRQGDSGQTSLFGGERVDKDHVRLEAYGSLDELNALLGLLAGQQGVNAQQKSWLENIQSRLFDIGAHLATPGDSKPALTQKLPVLHDIWVESLEKQIDAWDEELPLLKKFILPGGHQAAGHAHLARTICRRCERRVFSLTRVEPVEKLILTFLNRLSDAFFVFARVLNKSHDIEETEWTPSD